MNRPIRILAIGCLVLFLALLINANYLQFVQADDLNDKAGNRRVLDEQFSRDRGPILVDGDPIAESVEVDDEYDYQRKYPTPLLYAHLTGFYSYTYGSIALENSQNDILSGDDDRLFVNRVVDLVGNEQPKGGSVALTIDPKVQKAAQDGLMDLDRLGDGFKGSVVALDPSNGAVLGMVNRPSYNPNDIATHDLDQLQKAYERLLNDKNEPMRNRAATETVPPGSTFKLVTAAAALDELNLNPDSNVFGGETYSVNGYDLYNESRGSCAGGNQATLRQAVENSCNTSFGSLAVKVGEDAMRAQADKFGFGDDDYLDGLATEASRFSADGTPDMSDNEDLLAKTGIGQQDVAATPLQMAMVTAGVANDGEVMEPYIVDEVRSPDFDVLDKADPHPIDGQPAMSESNAKKLQDMLVSTVNNGTASVAQISGVDVGGKTGTAQRAAGVANYSWFVAFAPADDPQVAVAVMVDPPKDYGGDVTGGGIAGPIAHDVLTAVLD